MSEGRWCGVDHCPCQDGDPCHYEDHRDTKAMQDPRECLVPPKGWRCTCEAGHEPPCAADPICTCDVRPPQRESALGLTIGRYRIYLSRVEGETRFDPACPFHGDNGSMVRSVDVAGEPERSLGEVVADKQREVEPFVNWSYRDQQVDLALGKLHCANHGHRWWRMVDRYICASCGATR